MTPMEFRADYLGDASWCKLEDGSATGAGADVAAGNRSAVEGSLQK